MGIAFDVHVFFSRKKRLLTMIFVQYQQQFAICATKIKTDYYFTIKQR